MTQGRVDPPVKAGHPLFRRDLPALVPFQFEGQVVHGVAGEPVAMSLWALGIRVLGWNEETGAPRSLFCTIGHCFECRLTIDGERDRRACLVPLQEGMEVVRQARPDGVKVIDGMMRP